MKRALGTSVRMTIATLVLTGLLYPVLMTGLAQLFFPRQANGSLVRAGNREIGSELIGQAFSSPDYFRGRPSAAGAGYDPGASGGSNLGATSKKLHDRVQADVDRLRAENPAAPGPIPVDLVTASASGLDPHVSAEAAIWEAPGVAAARGVPEEAIRALVRAHIETPTFGFLGEPRVNVVLLNLDLDRRYPRAPRTAGG